MKLQFPKKSKPTRAVAVAAAAAAAADESSRKLSAADVLTPSTSAASDTSAPSSSDVRRRPSLLLSSRRLSVADASTASATASGTSATSSSEGRRRPSLMLSSRRLSLDGASTSAPSPSEARRRPSLMLSSRRLSVADASTASAASGSSAPSSSERRRRPSLLLSSRKLVVPDASTSSNSAAPGASAPSPSEGGRRPSLLISIAGRNSRRRLLESTSSSRGLSTPTSESLQDLIRKRRWSDLERFLCTEEGLSQLIPLRDKEEEEEERSDVRGGTVLHEACRRSAPLPVIRTICDLLLSGGGGGGDSDGGSSSIINSRDRRGRTPLHCYASASRLTAACCECSSLSTAAACSGCGSADATSAADAVGYLLSCCAGGPMEASAARDSDGRTPLHLACGAGFDECSSSSSRNDERVDDHHLDHPVFSDIPAMAAHCSENNAPTVLALICADPSLINDEDDVGITPLEYAIASNAPPDVLEVLKKEGREEKVLQVECFAEQQLDKSNKAQQGPNRDKEENENECGRSTVEMQEALKVAEKSRTLLRVTSERKIKNGAQAA